VDSAPRWIGELTRLLPIRSQLVLAGNIRDSFPTPLAAGATLAPLLRCLWAHLAPLDYRFILVYDPVEGLRPYPNEEAIQNDIEDLSRTLPHLKGRKAGEFIDLSLLKSMDEEGFFKRLHGK